MTLRFGVTAALCALATLVAPDPAPAQTRISIGFTPNAEAATAFVAKEKGFFARRGLDVELVPVAINSTLPAALMSGSIQIGGTTPTVFIQAVDGGLDLVAVAGMSVTSRTATGVGVVARKGSGITGPKDLVGRKVGAPGLGAVLHVMTRRWLIENEVDPAKVTFIEATFPTHGDLVKAGTVDAVVTVDPFLSRMAAAGIGDRIVNLLAEMPEGETALFYATTGEWARKSPDVMKAFREAIAEASAFVAADPDATRAAVGKVLKIPPEVLKSIALPKTDPAIRSEQISWWVDVMKRQDMLQAKVDAKRLVIP